MNELLEKGQLMSIVPQNFKNADKGKIVRVENSFFLLETFHKPEGIEPKKVMEFYSQTKNGMLYFNSSIAKVDGNVIVVTIPRKHRFLQRRMFTRIKYSKDLELMLDNKKYKAASLDLSAGGIKLKTIEKLNLDEEYDLSMELINENFINCKYKPIKIEKNEDGFYTAAGRFVNLTRTDRMKIVQFCIRKDIENMNR